MKTWYFIAMGLFILTGCYQPYNDCEEPHLYLISDENAPFDRAYLDFNVTEDDTIVRRRFHLDADEWLFRSLHGKSKRNACEDYSAVHRRRYNCEDCPYDFLIEDVAIESESQRDLKKLYLLKNDSLLSSSKFYNYGQDATGWYDGFGFGYHGEFGLFGYRGHELKIEI